MSEAPFKRYVMALCEPTLSELLSDNSVIPDDLLGRLARRRSPLLQTAVVHIDGNALRHGDSGAPVLLANDNRLLGVVLGGIPGAEYMAWAAPWTPDGWSKSSTPATRSALNELAGIRLDTTAAVDAADVFGDMRPTTRELPRCHLEAQACPTFL